MRSESDRSDVLDDALAARVSAAWCTSTADKSGDTPPGNTLAAFSAADLLVPLPPSRSTPACEWDLPRSRPPTPWRRSYSAKLLAPLNRSRSRSRGSSVSFSLSCSLPSSLRGLERRGDASSGISPRRRRAAQ